MTDGAVTLSRQVARYREKLQAGKDAQRVPGVHGVAQQTTMHPARESTGTRVEPTVSVAGIQASITQALVRRATVDAQRCFVSVDGSGTVTLQGRVSSCPQRQRAGRVAWSAPGVHRVINHLHVQ